MHHQFLTRDLDNVDICLMWSGQFSIYHSRFLESIHIFTFSDTLCLGYESITSLAFLSPYLMQRLVKDAFLN